MCDGKKASVLPVIKGASSLPLCHTLNSITAPRPLRFVNDLTLTSIINISHHGFTGDEGWRSSFIHQMTLVLLQKGAPLAYRLSLDLVQITYQHWIGSSMFNRPFLRVLYPTSGSPLTITQPPWPCNLMPYEGLHCARCSYYTLMPIVDDTCKRRPLRRRVGGTSWRKTPMPIRSVGH